MSGPSEARHRQKVPVTSANHNPNNDSVISMQPLPPLNPATSPATNSNLIINTHDDPTIRVLTLNVWGLKYISKFRTERIRHIAHLVTTMQNPNPQLPPQPEPPTILCLQELFTHTDYLLLRELLHPHLPHGHFYHSGAFGSGLAILSRWPIVETRMVPYRLNGRPSAFWRGDWYVGKGVACARIILPSGRSSPRVVEVFNTHLHAPYDEGTPGKDTYKCHRAAQAWEVGGLMQRAGERGSLVIGAGDFNMVVGELEWRVIAQRAPRLRDVWRAIYPHSSVGAWIDECEKTRLRETGSGGLGANPPSVRQSIAMHGHTCDSVLNTWRWSDREQRELLTKGRERAIDPDEEADPKAKRLDYIFLGQQRGKGRGERGGGGSDEESQCRVRQVRICMTERHPTLKCSLSDHFGVLAEIGPVPLASASSSSSSPSSSSSSLPNPNPLSPSDPDPDSDLYRTILSLIATYTHRSRTHRRRRLVHFIVSVIITLACYVAVWFSPGNYLGFVLTVLASLGLMLGAVDGLIGGLFGGAELRALKEWEGEVRGAMKHSQAERAGCGDEGQDEWNKEVEEMGRVRDWF